MSVAQIFPSSIAATTKHCGRKPSSSSSLMRTLAPSSTSGLREPTSTITWSAIERRPKQWPRKLPQQRCLLPWHLLQLLLPHRLQLGVNLGLLQRRSHHLPLQLEELPRQHAHRRLPPLNLLPLHIPQPIHQHPQRRLGLQQVRQQPLKLRPLRPRQPTHRSHQRQRWSMTPVAAPSPFTRAMSRPRPGDCAKGRRPTLAAMQSS